MYKKRNLSFTPNKSIKFNLSININIFFLLIIL